MERSSLERFVHHSADNEVINLFCENYCGGVNMVPYASLT